MRDPRVENLAKILVGYSTKVKEGDTVVIDGASAAEPLLLAIYEETLKAGGQPMLNVGIDGQSASYFKLARDLSAGRVRRADIERPSSPDPPAAWLRAG